MDTQDDIQASDAGELEAAEDVAVLDEDVEKAAGDDVEGDFQVHYIPFAKVANEQRIVSGVVLKPEEVDAHGDIYSAEVIRKAAYDFLAGFGTETTLGLQHSNFEPPTSLCESYIAPCDFTLGATKIKKGTWIMSVKVNDDKLWQRIKRGEITGFSIGGVAKVRYLKKQPAKAA